MELLKAHHDPHGVALGVAIGSFIGILPLYGLHTIICLAALFIIPRANKLAILVGSNISMPPTIAIITWTAYDIGRLLLPDKNYPPLSLEYLKALNMSRIGEFYYPLFIGSPALGLLVAVILYIATWVVADRIRKSHAGKQ